MLFALCSTPAGPAELRPGVWAGNDLSSFPLPTSGYQVYLLGEMHGVKEIENILGAYLERLQASGVRDVAIEEDAVYQRDAQAYVAWKSDRIPGELCLRAGILDTVRRFNKERAEDQLVRIRLVDIDSPAAAIRRHLLIIKEQVDSGDKVRIPRVSDIRTHGLQTVDELDRLTADAQALGELRTIRHSIRAFQQGFEAGIGQNKGSPYLDDREQAIASNIIDLVRDADCGGVLALYGADHVSRKRKRDGGPKRDSDFAPMALRLEQAGVRAFSVVTFPLSGRWRWRGRQGEMLWTASEGSLANGERLDKFLAAAHQPPLLYVDRSRERITLPSIDITALDVDAFLLISTATAMEDRCATVPGPRVAVLVVHRRGEADAAGEPVTCRHSGRPWSCPAVFAARFTTCITTNGSSRGSRSWNRWASSTPAR